MGLKVKLNKITRELSYIWFKFRYWISPVYQREKERELKDYYGSRIRIKETKNEKI